MKKVVLVIVTMSVSLASLLLGALLLPFQGVAAALTALANGMVSFSVFSRTKIALATLPISRMRTRLVEASEMGIRA